ncbi:hypothetical protein G7Y89_g1827 [Cudoniella acicularis]|uniref:UBC core domain-containing protein n=1 Tax=Cudoniella acicularis TaxID=354080 RepID=A0A8H4W9X1_9HELO|nr:hypothetical protein G7Y89_g1827 [Cudoniella acicularis]
MMFGLGYSANYFQSSDPLELYQNLRVQRQLIDFILSDLTVSVHQKTPWLRRRKCSKGGFLFKYPCGMFPRYNLIATPRLRILYQLSFKIFFSTLHFSCHNDGCETILQLKEAGTHIEDVLARCQIIPPLSQLTGLVCPTCGTETCIACGKKPSLSAENLFTPLGVINHCCQESRAFGVWLLLSRFDDEERRVRDRIKVASASNTTSGKPGNSSKSNGVGYASELGYPSDPYTAYHQHQHSDLYPHHKDKSPEMSDEIITNTVVLLTALSPDLSATAPNETKCLDVSALRFSLLLDRISTLLRNDSIENICERKSLYEPVISFLTIIFDNDSLQPLLFEKRLDKTQSPGLRVLTEFKMESLIAKEGLSASIFGSMESLYRQAKQFLEANTISIEPQIDHTLASKICKSIVQLYEKMAPLSPEPNGELDWSTFCKNNRVTFSEEVLRFHKFTVNFTKVKNGAANRANIIGKEISNMLTSLPDGVFLKVAETRSDVMKVLMVGPGGGPYAGGLFVFDMFLPTDYPASPPLMHFALPTADLDGGNFNPNLHYGGGVCLSLLNTWSGSPSEMWQPHKSTILSVLVSVHSMILGAPYPWYNEPGRDTGSQSICSAAKSYNKLIQCKTVKGAMIYWLAEAFKKHTTSVHLWKDICQTYWEYNGKAVLESVKTWAAEGNKRLISFEPSATLARQAIPQNPFQQNNSMTSSADGKGKGKGKAKMTAETLNLVENLAEALGLSSSPTVKNEPGEPETSNNNSYKRKASTQLTPSTHFEPLFAGPNPSLTQTWASANANIGNNQGTLADNKSAETKVAGHFNENKKPEYVWKYTGKMAIKDLRLACKDLGVNGALSIAETLRRLEASVNGNLEELVNEELELIDKWVRPDSLPATSSKIGSRKSQERLSGQVKDSGDFLKTGFAEAVNHDEFPNNGDGAVSWGSHKLQ